MSAKKKYTRAKLPEVIRPKASVLDHDEKPKVYWHTAKVTGFKGTERQYYNLSPAKKRMVIAADAIQWLDTGKIAGQYGAYLVFGVADYCDEGGRPRVARSAKERDARVLMSKVVKSQARKKDPCLVCARGAMFLATLDRENELKIRPYTDPLEVLAREAGNKGYLVQTGVWDAKTLFRMESCFEDTSSTTNMAVTPVTNYLREYAPHINKVDYPTERLRAILVNIVRNKGEFIPFPKK